MLAIVIIVLLGMTQIALGQNELSALPPDAFVERGFWATILSADFIAKITPLIIGGQIILYGLAEGLTRVSDGLDKVGVAGTRLAKVASFLSEVSWVSGVIISKFGYSTPKLIIEEKVKAATEKEPQKGA